MAHFRKRPVAIEARQFDGTLASARPLLEWINDLGASWCFNGTMTIPTLEGPHTARAGDWIIKGVAGEFYPCRDDIFLQTYEPA